MKTLTDNELIFYVPVGEPFAMTTQQIWDSLPTRLVVDKRCPNFSESTLLNFVAAGLIKYKRQFRQYYFWRD